MPRQCRLWDLVTNQQQHGLPHSSRGGFSLTNMSVGSFRWLTICHTPYPDPLKLSRHFFSYRQIFIGPWLVPQLSYKRPAEDMNAIDMIQQFSESIINYCDKIIVDQVTSVLLLEKEKSAFQQSQKVPGFHSLIQSDNLVIWPFILLSYPVLSKALTTHNSTGILEFTHFSKLFHGGSCLDLRASPSWFHLVSWAISSPSQNVDLNLIVSEYQVPFPREQDNHLIHSLEAIFVLVRLL